MSEDSVAHPYMHRPGTVTAVVVLVWISAVFALVLGVVFLVAALLGASSGIATAGVAGVVLGVFFLLLGGITAAVASRLAHGGNGARLLVSILQVLQIAGAIASFTANGPVANTSTGNIVLAVVILVLLWNERANAFFHSRSA